MCKPVPEPLTHSRRCTDMSSRNQNSNGTNHGSSSNYGGSGGHNDSSNIPTQTTYPQVRLPPANARALLSLTNNWNVGTPPAPTTIPALPTPAAEIGASLTGHNPGFSPPFDGNGDVVLTPPHQIDATTAVDDATTVDHATSVGREGGGGASDLSTIYLDFVTAIRAPYREVIDERESEITQLRAAFGAETEKRAKAEARSQAQSIELAAKNRVNKAQCETAKRMFEEIQRSIEEEEVSGTVRNNKRIKMFEEFLATYVVEAAGGPAAAAAAGDAAPAEQAGTRGATGEVPSPPVLPAPAHPVGDDELQRDDNGLQRDDDELQRDDDGSGSGSEEVSNFGDGDTEEQELERGAEDNVPAAPFAFPQVLDAVAPADELEFRVGPELTLAEFNHLRDTFSDYKESKGKNRHELITLLNNARKAGYYFHTFKPRVRDGPNSGFDFTLKGPGQDIDSVPELRATGAEESWGLASGGASASSPSHAGPSAYTSDDDDTVDGTAIQASLFSVSVGTAPSRKCCGVHIRAAHAKWCPNA